MKHHTTRAILLQQNFYRQNYSNDPKKKIDGCIARTSLEPSSKYCFRLDIELPLDKDSREVAELNFIRENIKPLLVINSVYLVAFTVTMYGLLPLQSRFTPDLASYASLLFLPHGVRILSAWLYGWRAIMLIAPSALFTHFLIFGGDGFELAGLLGAFSGVTCAAFTFWLLSFAGLDFRISKQKTANWRDLMIAGSVASIFNTYGMGLAFDHNLATLSGYLIGDITGLFACMFALMLIFKLERQFRNPI